MDRAKTSLVLATIVSFLPLLLIYLVSGGSMQILLLHRIEAVSYALAGAVISAYIFYSAAESAAHLKKLEIWRRVALSAVMALIVLVSIYISEIAGLSYYLGVAVLAACFLAEWEIASGIRLERKEDGALRALAFTGLGMETIYLALALFLAMSELIVG